MEFNISMDATPRPAIDPKAPLFASVLGNAADLGGGECVFRTASGETHVMTHQVLQALDQCRRFLSLAEHVQTVRQVIPSAPAEGVARVLESLVTRRLMISESDFVAALQTGAQRVESETMSLLIRLDDDAQNNVRLLQSLEKNPNWSEATAKICILANAATAQDSAVSNALQSLAKRIGKRLSMTDHAAAMQRVVRLAGKDASMRASIDLLFPQDPAAHRGRAFNLDLSLLAGQRGMMLNSQQQWPLRRHPEFETGIELRSAALPGARFFATRDIALASGIESDDLFGEHARACGAGVGALMDAATSSAWQTGALRGLAMSEFPEDIESLKVLTTTIGQRGGSDLLPRDDWYLLDNKSRNAFAADRDTYLRQLQTPSLWVGHRRASLSQHETTLPFSVDARHMLPCALPFGDSADGGFHALLHCVRPDSISVRLPHAIGFSEVKKNATVSAAAVPFTPDFNRFATDFLSSRAGDLHAQDSAQRLQGVAARLRDLASSKPGQLVAFTSEYLQFVRSERINRLQSAAQEAGAQAPVHWLADLRAQVTANGRALVESSVPRLRDDPEGDEAQTAAALSLRLQQAAQCVEAWSVLWPRLQEDDSLSHAWNQ